MASSNDHQLPAAVGAIRAALERELAGREDAVLWPGEPLDIPDATMLFRVAYLGPEFAGSAEDEIRRRLDTLLRFWGQTRRQYRNALAFAMPNPVRWKDLIRRRAAPNDFAGAEALPSAEELIGCYDSIVLPSKSEGFGVRGELDRAAVRPPEGRSLHDGVLASLDPYLLELIETELVVGLIQLGEIDGVGVRRLLFPLGELARWFFCFLGFPRVRGVGVIRNCVREGIATGRFGLLRQKRLLPLDALDEDQRRRVILHRRLADDEIDFSIDGGYLVAREGCPA
jgi:hypothetical protein